MLFLKFPTIEELNDEGYPNKLQKRFEKVFVKKNESEIVTLLLMNILYLIIVKYVVFSLDQIVELTLYILE